MSCKKAVLVLMLAMGLFFIINSTIGSQAGDKKQTDSYLPMAKGNRWKYLRKIDLEFFKNKETYVVHLGNWKLTLRSSEIDKLAEESFEEYIVGNKVNIDNNPYWEIKVIPKSARDRRYEYAVKILWGKVPPGEKKDIRVLFNERITYNENADPIKASKMLMESQGNDLNIEHISPFLLDIDPHEVEGSKVTLEELSIKEKLIYSGKNIDIQVPAGNFKNCMEMIREFEGEGWKTYSYYAKNVGLVKEVRKKSNDDIIYSLELVEYAIAPKRAKK